MERPRRASDFMCYFLHFAGVDLIDARPTSTFLENPRAAGTIRALRECVAETAES
jgi:hypothetical protein